MPDEKEITQRLGFAFDSDFFEFGYVQVENATTNDVELSDSAYRTLLVIREFAWKTGECYPGLARLAQMRGKTTVSIMTHIAELVARGYLEKQCRGRGKTNLYIIKTPQGRIKALSPKENLSSTDKENLSQRLCIEEPSDTPTLAIPCKAGDETSPTEKSAYACNDRIMELLNAFRDLHWDRIHKKYMIVWARDKKLAREMLAAYDLAALRDMMGVFLTQPHREYSMPTFHRAIPEILLIVGDLQKKELRQKKALAEAQAFEQYAEAHKYLSEGVAEKLANLEAQVEEITSAGSQIVISNPALREKLAGLEHQVASIWEDLHLQAVVASGLPGHLRAQLENCMQYNVLAARDMALKLAASHRRKGGNGASDSKVPP